MPLEPLTSAFITFTLTFAILRAAEWLYHHFRRTRDWSPHWGSWLFAVLAGIYVFISSLGR